jgi:hypothetical protein
MADIPGALVKLNDVEVAQDAPITEALFSKIGANINALIDEEADLESRVTALETTPSNVVLGSPFTGALGVNTGPSASITVPSTASVLLIVTGSPAAVPQAMNLLAGFNEINWYKAAVEISRTDVGVAGNASKLWTATYVDVLPGAGTFTYTMGSRTGGVTSVGGFSLRAIEI